MKIKTQDLTGAALDWAVAAAEGKSGACEVHAGNVLYGRVTSGFIQYRPSEKWELVGPIIEREHINVSYEGKGVWLAGGFNGVCYVMNCDGPTMLIAAMRAFVTSKLGDEVDVPDELARY